jgi:hypothetical protein
MSSHRRRSAPDADFINGIKHLDAEFTPSPQVRAL